jgi:putative glutamine amidotransferase
MSAPRIAVLAGDKSEPYCAAVRLVSLEPVVNPESLDGIEGILLTGGADVNPLLYGEEPHPETQPPDDARDTRELRFTTDALRLDLPILAICRGAQLFNVAHGGTLKQHIESGAHKKGGEAEAHRIRIDPASLLAQILGICDYPVNSRHHQAVARTGAGLCVAATCPSDGIVEALENPSRRFALAVQWHPEDRVSTHEGDRRLFEALARAVAENRR